MTLFLRPHLLSYRPRCPCDADTRIVPAQYPSVSSHLAMRRGSSLFEQESLHTMEWCLTDIRRRHVGLSAHRCQRRNLHTSQCHRFPRLPLWLYQPSLSATLDCLLDTFFSLRDPCLFLYSPYGSRIPPVAVSLVYLPPFWLTWNPAKVMKLTHSFNIIKVLARDGILYYVSDFHFSKACAEVMTLPDTLITISLCNFLIWILDPFASYVAVGLLKSLQATICSRLLLNLRGILASRAPTMSQFENDFPESLIDLDAFGGPSQSNQSQGSSSNE
ncbi:LOW QUALITY PROTEIN: hypothetical protein CVT26_016191 [Gymnopilus dilepis]|uniref:Uncharacterized protein n=1 Tax=Gymnopilus dilepis TaxID=231916 RepID=A0A409XZ45_9AGAR|nr:LOW QUALITY PROTEIN: hypothetical protein CVT26_016191 [Gymnopilus dilepis]